VYLLFSIRGVILSFNSSTPDTTNGAGTAYPFGAPEFIPCLL